MCVFYRVELTLNERACSVSRTSTILSFPTLEKVCWIKCSWWSTGWSVMVRTWRCFAFSWMITSRRRWSKSVDNSFCISSSDGCRAASSNLRSIRNSGLVTDSSFFLSLSFRYIYKWYSRPWDWCLHVSLSDDPSTRCGKRSLPCHDVTEKSMTLTIRC